MPGRDEPVRFNASTEPLAYPGYSNRYEWLQMAGDPLAYAEHMKDAAIAGCGEEMFWERMGGE